MSDLPPSLRNHPSVRAFVTAAQRYCALIESKPTDRDEWLAELLHAIAILYAAAPVVRDLGLPEHDHRANIPQELQLSNDHWQVIYNYTRQLLGPHAHYTAFFNPTTANPAKDEPTAGDLADDLDDILFQWVHYGHIHHWGRHAVDAMRALHWLVYK